MNENAKAPAFSGELPELDHNEIVGWESAAELGRFSAVFLDDADLHPRVRQRIELTRGLIAASGAPTFRIESIGETRTERLLSLVVLGDLVSLYLAVLRGVDPTPIPPMSWLLPSACWTYYLQTLTEHDQYRILANPEVVYGVPLPAGAQVNYRRWARRVQWAVFRSPQTLQGVEYVDQVNFCGKRVCSGTLARDQEIQGLPCRAQTVVDYSQIDGRVTECTLAQPFVRQGVTWPTGTTVRIGSGRGDSYLPPAGADPIRITGLLVHCGLIVWLTPEGRIRELDRNQSLADADTRVEVGDIILKSDQYRFLPDGTIHGGVLAQDAVIDGKPKKSGDPVVIPAPSP